jgi:predicted flap endonuclease-1-like 5' DNA nuclease
MRSDYLLYGAAIILFLVTAIFGVLTDDFERIVSVVTTVSFGIFFAGLGYILRPKEKPSTITVTAPLPATADVVVASTPKTEAEPAPAIASEVEEKTPPSSGFVPLKLRLTKIKGIGEKRSTQLKALGISNITDLSRASAKELAVKMDIPSKTTTRWIASAKEIVEKA